LDRVTTRAEAIPRTLTLRTAFVEAMADREAVAMVRAGVRIIV